MPDFIYLGDEDNVQVNGQKAAKQVEQTEQRLEEMVEVVRAMPRPPIKKIEDKIVWVDEIEHDHSKRCQHCKGKCGYISVAGVWECHGFVPMTNGDCIRRMSDKDLAYFIRPFKCVDCPLFSLDCGIGVIGDNRTCEERILSWLKEETLL